MNDQNPSTQYSFIIVDASDQGNGTEDLLAPFGCPVSWFKSLDAFQTHIQQLAAENNTILLIISGSFGVQISKDVQAGKYPQIHSIYVYCQNVGAHRRWASNVDQVSPFAILSIEYINSNRFCLNKTAVGRK